MEPAKVLKKYKSGNYLRLSKEDVQTSGRETLQSNSIENQKAFIEDFLKGRPEIETGQFYVDDGCSGVSFDRPAFQRMLRDIGEHKINCVIVKDLSRFGRNYIEAGRYIEQLFPMLGVRFIAINDNYDSADAGAVTNNMVVPFKNLINDAYCRDISVKIRSCLEVKRKRGEFTGAFAVYGYRKGEDKNKLVIDSDAANVVEEIFRMKIDGMSPQAIAGRLNLLGVLSPAEYKKEQGSSYKAMFQTHVRASWSAMAIFRILTNEVYTGTLIQGKESTPNHKVKKRVKKQPQEWIRIENAHEAIIKKADFELVANIMGKDTRASEGRSSVSPYSGYLICGDCGCSMTRRKVPGGSGQYVYYICSGNKRNKNLCSSHRISEKALGDAVVKSMRLHWTYMAGLQKCVEYVREAAISSCDKLKMAALQCEKRKEETANYSRLRMECYRDYKNKLITQEEYIFFRGELDNRVKEGEAAIAELEKRKQQLLENSSKKGHWMEQYLINESMELKRSVLVRFVEKIYVYEDHRIEIVFRYRDEIKRWLIGQRMPAKIRIKGAV